MDYLPLVIILGGLSACAISAYELLDAIECDEYERSSASSGHARIPIDHGVRVARADSDQWEVRIRGLEARLERLERECDRVGALALAVRA